MPAATTTPSDLADELGRDAKVVRAFLRENFPRKAEEKNNRWKIPVKTANAVRKHFTEKEEAKAS